MLFLTAAVVTDRGDMHKEPLFVLDSLFFVLTGRVEACNGERQRGMNALSPVQ